MSGVALGWLAGAPWPGIVAATALGGAIVAWIAGARAREPAAAIRPIPHAYPNRDPVSVAVDALHSATYSRLLDRAYVQLAALSVRTTGRPLEAVPHRWRLWRRRVAPPVRAVQQLRSRAALLRARAQWRERRWAPRSDPWRTTADSDRRFRAEIARFLVDLGRASGAAGA